MSMSDCIKCWQRFKSLFKRELPLSWVNLKIRWEIWRIRMRTININGWELEVNEDLQGALSEEERELGAIAFDINISWYLNNPKVVEE